MAFSQRMKDQCRCTALFLGQRVKDRPVFRQPGCTTSCGVSCSWLGFAGAWPPLSGKVLREADPLWLHLPSLHLLTTSYKQYEEKLVALQVSTKHTLLLDFLLHTAFRLVFILSKDPGVKIQGKENSDLNPTATPNDHLKEARGHRKKLDGGVTWADQIGTTDRPFFGNVMNIHVCCKYKLKIQRLRWARLVEKSPMFTSAAIKNICLIVTLAIESLLASSRHQQETKPTQTSVMCTSPVSFHLCHK
ncbi:uncharacterized protein LOC133625299 [Colius striatus]|uniref:uncharacterized protein LOC133625299 n=1 Tax=Colius striatus TaxID=57412 RepID=UPI002B1D264D|nr:uncharacterized protein LOC133625299 [Colius striatus]